MSALPNTGPLPDLSSVENQGLADLLADSSWQLAQAIAQKKDVLIQCGVKERLGWMPPFDECMWRMQVLGGDITGSQVWYLDGKALVEIWPVQTQLVAGGAAQKMQASVAYRYFPAG